MARNMKSSIFAFVADGGGRKKYNKIDVTSVSNQLLSVVSQTYAATRPPHAVYFSAE